MRKEVNDASIVSDSNDIPTVVVSGPIRLGQFLKFADLVESGAEARDVITDGDVRVNGETEMRRGRQLRPGDVVEVLYADGVLGARVAALD